MKKHMKALAIVLVMCMILTTLAACTAVQVSGKLVINADNTGTRTITGMIAKSDDNGDGYGSSYYYLKQHGDALKTQIEGIYTANVEGCGDWLTVSVDDSGADWEVVTLTVSFDSVEDYAAKMKALTFDAALAETFADPSFVRNEDGTFVFEEPASVITGVFKSLQAAVMADESLFDETCTKDGAALNSAASLDDLIGFGVELIKPENGEVLTLNVDGGADIVVSQDNGVFVFSGNAAGEKVVAPHETTMVLHYGFEDVLTNDGTCEDSDLVYGVGSPAAGPVFEQGVVGKGIKMDGSTYLASPNRDYKYEELTVSFYYRMDAYTETDTGANMVIVPAGLGALNAGVIDIEYIKETTAPGVQLMAKMNSVDWMTQDKLYSEEYVLDNNMNDWHHYAIVYQNEYEEGEISDAFVFMYIDGKLAARARLSVAAGLPYSLGCFDDGSFGDPNGGFNVGGYFEADQVKRACTGMLDELMIFDGALSEEEVNTLCYTVKVDKEYDPNAAETVPEPAETQPAATEPAATAPAATQPAAEQKDPSGVPVGVIAAVVVVLVIAVVAVVFARKKKA